MLLFPCVCVCVCMSTCMGVTGKEKPWFWKNPKWATAFREVVLFVDSSFWAPDFISLHRGGVTKTGDWGQLEPTGTQLERRGLRADLLRVSTRMSSRCRWTGGRTWGSTVARWARLLSVGWLAAGQASDMFDSMTYPFRLSFRNELTVLLTFSFLWMLCLASIQSGPAVLSLCFYFRYFFS